MSGGADPPAARAPTHLLYVATEDWFFRSHFMPMARAALAAGFRVTLAARLGAAAPAIEREGIRLVPLALRRDTLDPLRILREAAALRRLLRAERPDLLHLIALKPVLVGGLAARGLPLAGVVLAVTGVGYLGIARGWKARAARRLLWWVLGRLLRRPGTWLLVENEDDARTFGGCAAGRIVQVGGAGVDPAHFAALPPPEGAPARAAVVARMVWSKGVDTVVAAQRRLREEGVPLDLTLVGAPDPDNPQGYPAATLEAWARAPDIEWLGRQDDVRAVWRRADIAVLASRGGEGLPRSLLEAAASARPLVTTDVPGCRGFVRDGIEGFVVPPDDDAALAQALARLARDPGLRRRMGEAARARILDGYTEAQVAAAVVRLYATILAARA